MEKNKIKILVVDDDKNFTLTLCQILYLEGYKCYEAHSVGEAEKILNQEKIDLVLSDVRMPNENGPELYYRIKNKMPDIPFILMTAYSSNEIIEKALDSGILAALPKPIDIQNILAFLDKLNRGLQAAIVCDSGISCRLINDFLESKNFNYAEFGSISELIESGRDDFSIVFIDIHHPANHLKSDIRKLRKHLPQKTIVVLCAFEDIECDDEHKDAFRSLNLVILPHENKVLGNLDKILDREYYQLAKKHFSRDNQ